MSAGKGVAPQRQLVGAGQGPGESWSQAKERGTYMATGLRQTASLPLQKTGGETGRGGNCGGCGAGEESPLQGDTTAGHCGKQNAAFLSSQGPRCLSFCIFSEFFYSGDWCLLLGPPGWALCRAFPAPRAVGSTKSSLRALSTPAHLICSHTPPILPTGASLVGRVPCVTSA